MLSPSRETVASACIRRDQAFAQAPATGRRFRVYKGAQAFSLAPVRETLPCV